MHDEVLPRALWVAAAFVLIIAAFPLPYGYYTFTRIVTCLACVFLAYSSYRSVPPAVLWATTFTLLAVLFNPVIPIHLTRNIWMVLDLCSAAVILAHLHLFQGSKRGATKFGPYFRGTTAASRNRTSQKPNGEFARYSRE